MRVITGKARGRKLVTLEGDDVRPTTDRVKESLFNIIQFDIEGASVLDLFAGSGQLGIEALSRGAKHCTFVDSSNRSIEVVKQNLKTVGFEKRASVFCGDGKPVIITEVQYEGKKRMKAADFLRGHPIPDGTVLQ